MAISTIKHGEPLFVIIYRDPRAQNLLKSWISENKIQHAQVQDNKMQLFDYHSLSVFMMTWNNGWSNVVIWDAWNRRHIHQNT